MPPLPTYSARATLFVQDHLADWLAPTGMVNTPGGRITQTGAVVLALARLLDQVAAEAVGQARRANETLENRGAS